LSCSASTVRDKKKKFNYTKQELGTGFPTSHQPRFYAAPNFLKMGIKMGIKMEIGIKEWNDDVRTLTGSS